MSANTTVITFPANLFAQLVDKDVVAKMNKEDGKSFGVLLKNAADGVTLEVNDTTIVKSLANQFKDSEGKVLPEGAKIFFNEDASLFEARFPTPVKKAAVEPKTATRTTGSYQAPQQSKMFDRQ